MRIATSEAEFYLRKIGQYKRQISSILSEIDDIQRTVGGLKGMDYSGIRVQSSSDGSPLETAYVKAHDRIQALNVLASGLMDKRHLMIDQVRNLRPIEHSLILMYMFIDCKSWQSVVDSMGYSEDHCWKLRRQALDAFYSAYLANSTNKNQ